MPTRSVRLAAIVINQLDGWTFCVNMPRPRKSNLDALVRLGVPVTPARPRILKWAPLAHRRVLRLGLRMSALETLAFLHAKAAKDLMDAIATDVEAPRREAHLPSRAAKRPRRARTSWAA